MQLNMVWFGFKGIKVPAAQHQPKFTEYLPTGNEISELQTKIEKKSETRLISGNQEGYPFMVKLTLLNQFYCQK